MQFVIGDRVEYRYGQVIFSGTVIARGYVRDVFTDQELDDDDKHLRYIVQQHQTGVLHVYGPRHLQLVPK